MDNYSCVDKNLDIIMPISKPNVNTEDLPRLTLDINDGLPKFKFNEPGPAALANSIFQKNNIIDAESEQSFVVLGKASLDSISEASLASFKEIQQKNNNFEHTSLISAMGSSEIEENLRKVFKENIKLKEILRQNHDTIKQQFNTITMWQDEVMTVCNNHKQKFLETEELISHLKKENNKLREKISRNISLQSENVPLLLQNSNGLSSKTKGYSIPTDISLIMNNARSLDEKNDFHNIQENQSKNEQKLLQIDTLSEEMKNVNVNHLRTPEIIQELTKHYAVDIKLFCQQLQEANNLEVFKQKSDLLNLLELQKLVDKCCKKDLQLEYLKEIIKSLEVQIRTMTDNFFPELELSVEISEKASEDKYLFNKNLEFYNLKLRELGECFASQCSCYLRIQDLLKESVDIIDVFENSEVLFNNSLSSDKLKDYKDKLCHYRKRLIGEQLQSIDDKQTIIRVQKQFQKVLSDYHSVIYDLEILKDENSKLTIMQAKLTEESSKKLVEMEKYINEEKKILDNAKIDFLEERLNLQLEKKLVIEEKEKIKSKYSLLTQEKEKFIQKKASLSEEKASIDRQSRLYEIEEERLQKEKKCLENKCENLINEVDYLKQELKKNNVIVEQYKKNENLVSAYKIQMEIYETQLDEMYTTQKTLQEQLHALSMINLELQTRNEILENQQTVQE